MSRRMASGRPMIGAGVVSIASSMRAAGAVLARAAKGFLVAVCVLVGASPLLGYRTLTVLSGSMEPTLKVGDIVVERELRPAELRAGDIVTFRNPSDRDQLVTHRVRDVRVANGVAYVSTKGDANDSTERWTVAADGRVGVVAYRIHGLGFFLNWAVSRLGRLTLIVAPALVLGVMELVAIWRPRKRSPAPGFGGH